MRLIDRISKGLAMAESENPDSDQLTLYQRGFGQALQGAALILEEEGYSDAARFLFRLSRHNETGLGEIRKAGAWKAMIRASRVPAAHPGFPKIPAAEAVYLDLAGEIPELSRVPELAG